MDSEGLYRVEHNGHRVIWVPGGADSVKKRLLVCAHLEGAGLRGVDATMAGRERHCIWARLCRILRLAITFWWLECPGRASTASS